MAIGAAAGAAAGRLSDSGVDDKFMKELGEQLEPGSAAVIAARPPGVAGQGAEIKIQGTIIQTSLDNEAEERLAEALAAAGSRLRVGPRRRRTRPRRRVSSRWTARRSASRSLIPTRTLATCCRLRRARRAGDPVARHAAVDLPRGRARARPRPGGRRARAARLEARAGGAGRVRGAVRLRVRDRARHRRAGVGRDRRVRQRAPGVLGRADEKEWLPGHHVTAGADDTIRKALKDLAAGLPDAASALLGIAGGVFGSILSLVTLTFLALFLLMERPTITDWLFGFAAAGRSSGAGARCSRTRSARLVVADRQRRDLGGGRDGRRRLGLGCSACRSRSCSP